MRLETTMLNRFFQGTTGIPETDVAHTIEARAVGNVQIVDVREPDEWTEGRIPGAVHIPLGSLASRTNELDPGQETIVVCHAGVRSLTGADILLKAGFADAKSLAGGMIAWIGAGQPVERG
jgi:rhodanese-related sulfurtransferase